MNWMHSTHTTLFPIEHALVEISRRYELIGNGAIFTSLIEHVRNKNPIPGSPLVYTPSFALADLNKASDKSPCYGRRKAAALLEQLAALETAVACCIAAKAPIVKPLGLLLFDALALCQKFDQLRAAADAADRKRRGVCAKAGKLRQANLDPAREYAKELEVKLRPACGWKSDLERARVIASELKKFIIMNRISLVPGGNLHRTVRRWFGNNPPDSGQAA